MIARRVLVVSASVAGGHDGAAREVARRLRETGHAVQLVDALDLLPARVGHRICRLYQQQLTIAPRTWGWSLAALDSRALTALARNVARLAGRRLGPLLDDEVVLAVSTHPLATHALARARVTGRLRAPLVVHLTDPSVHRLSISSAATLTIAPTGTAACQARRLGAARVAVLAPLVAPAFRPAHGPAERERLRTSFHLPIRLRLALVVSGSWGVGQVEETVSDIATIGLATPVVVCGRNKALRTRLVSAGHHHVLGWVNDMAGLIRACDIVVQNAGGLTAAEALTSGIPVLTYRCLPGHGHTNAAALDTEGLVPWIRTTDALAALLPDRAEPDTTATEVRAAC